MRAKWNEWKSENPEKIQAKDRARQRCLDEWNPTRGPIPFHTLRRKEDKSKYNRTDIVVTKSTIHICECGNRYLKTRKGQENCLPCIAYSVV